MQQRFPEAQKMFAKAQRILESSPRIGKEQREMLASMELEILVQQAGEAGRSGDPEKARQVWRSMAERAEGMAADHDDNDPAFKLWTGIAGMLKAQAALARAIAQMSIYDFDHVDKGESAAAAKAANLLGDVSPPNAAATKYYSELLAVVEQLATIMLGVIGLSFQGDKGEFRALGEHVNAARQVIPAAAGLNPKFLEQACDQMDQWISNIQRLSKPSKKDLGVYGGFVACAAFCILLIIVAIVNKAFSLGASASTILSTCVPLALVAGFGLAGLRAWQSTRSDGPATQPASKK